MTELVYGNEVMYEHQARENRISSLSSYHEEAAVPQETDTLDTEIPVKLNPLQDINGIAGVVEGLEPVTEDDPSSYDLLAPPVMQDAQYTLEKRAEVLFSKDHLQMIFLDPGLLLKFTNFLSSTRPRSIPILIYYLDALKALRAIAYSNAIARTLDPISGHDFTQETLTLTTNSGLSTKAAQAFEVLVKEDLPAYITSTFVNVVSLSIRRKVAGTMPQHLRDASEGLAEVFCLTDMSRPDNPIVFASQGESKRCVRGCYIY